MITQSAVGSIFYISINRAESDRKVNECSSTKCKREGVLHVKRGKRSAGNRERAKETRMKSDRRQLGSALECKKAHLSEQKGEKKGEIAPKEFNINIVHAQTAWIPQSCPGDASPTTTWSPFPREKTCPPPRPSSPPLPTIVSLESSYHLHRASHHHHHRRHHY